MPSYHEFTSARTTEPDAGSLLTLLRATDATIGVRHVGGSAVYVVKRSLDSDWTVTEIAAAQTIIDTAPARTPSLVAQEHIKAWPIEQRALVLALIDQLNAVRAALPTPLAPITPAQVLTAVVNKAKTLNS